MVNVLLFLVNLSIVFPPKGSCQVSDVMEELEYSFKRTGILVMGREHMVMK